MAEGLPDRWSRSGHTAGNVRLAGTARQLLTTLERSSKSMRLVDGVEQVDSLSYGDRNLRLEIPLPIPKGVYQVHLVYPQWRHVFLQRT